MKTKIGSWLLTFSVLALLVLGYFMPQFVSMWTDRELESEIRQMENANVFLDMAKDEMDVLDRLYLFSRLLSDEYIGSAPVDSCRMTGTEVTDTAIRLLGMLGLSFDEQDIQVMPQLLINLESGESGIFWQCTWGGKRGIAGSAWLDDQTGFVVRFDLYVPEYTEYTDAILTELCLRLYPVDLVLLDTENPKEIYAVLILEMDKGSKQYRLPISLEGGWIMFNYDVGNLQMK